MDMGLVNPQAAPTTPWVTTPVPLELQVIDDQLPRQDTEQTIPMQLVSTGQEEQDSIVPTQPRAPNQEERESTVPLGWNTSMNRATGNAPVDDTGQPTFQVLLSDILTGQPPGEPPNSRVPLFPLELAWEPHFSWLTYTELTISDGEPSLQIRTVPVPSLGLVEPAGQVDPPQRVPEVSHNFYIGGYPIPPMHPLPYMQGLSVGMVPVYIQAPPGTATYGPPLFLPLN